MHAKYTKFITFFTNFISSKNNNKVILRKTVKIVTGIKTWKFSFAGT